MNPSPRPGDLLDHYRVETLVASSAMAFIFRATDTRTGAQVAVKIPRASGGAWPWSAGLETKISQGLNHPGIVKILPNSSSNSRYAVMEWLDGRSLRRIISDGEISVGRAVGIARNICSVLEYIHGRGIIHLDLKPDNVFVDAHDRVKLLDFGIAQKAKKTFLGRARSKQTGTPDYAAPEQIRGGFVDVRADIYSLGLILYEMLTSEVPFSGVGAAAALQLRISIDPPPAAEINSEIPLELDAIVKRAIARRPAERYPSAREFSRCLARLPQGIEPQLVASLVASD